MATSPWRARCSKNGEDIDYGGSPENPIGATGPFDFRDDLSVEGRFWVDQVMYTDSAEQGAYMPFDEWDRTL